MKIKRINTMANKPTLKQIVDIRNLAKHITIEIVIKTKGKFLFTIGLNIMKFGAWITGCNIQVITNGLEF